MMKMSKREGAVILLAAMFLAFTAGWFLRGSSTAEPLRVETQRRVEVIVTLPPDPTQRSGAEQGGPVNINTAGVEELMTLPGIGEKRAADIVAEREQNGPYQYPEDLTRVKGIGEETVEKLLDNITTEEGASDEDPGGG